MILYVCYLDVSFCFRPNKLASRQAITLSSYLTIMANESGSTSTASDE